MTTLFRNRILAFAVALLFSMHSQGSDYKTLLLEDFEFDSYEMINQKVEIYGDYYSFIDISPRTLAKIRDPRINAYKRARKAGDKSVERVKVSEMPEATLDLSKSPPTVYRWFAKDRCKTDCDGIYFRGTITIGLMGTPVLSLEDVSRDSLSTGEVVSGEQTIALVDKEKSSLGKKTLPAGSIPNEAGFDAWISQVPPSRREYDNARSVWDNMVGRSEHMASQQNDLSKGIIRGKDRANDFQTYYRGVRDSALDHIFEPYPYADSTSIWPRVAIQIEEAPPQHGKRVREFTYGQTTETDMCWRMSAKVWTGPVSEVDIAPFNWCFSEMRFNVAYNPVSFWGNIQRQNMILANQSTGVERTDGPVPPKTPLPQNGGFGAWNYANVMVGNVLLDMGFDYNNNDGRVWFNK